MRMYDLIHKKRDGKALTAEEIDFICNGASDGSIPDYQISAFTMAVFFQGMTDEETTNLVFSMTRSGDVLDLSDVPGIKVDKHGMGGVAQPVSTALGPLVAAAGVKVPMISGHGTGHTRGTLDILQAIPGYRDDLSPEEFKQQLQAIGLVITGATGRFTPADKKLYAMRAACATINNTALMAGSVMCKKLAEGCDRIIIDVKAGNGGFTRTMEEAMAFSRVAVNVGKLSGKPTSCLITNMSEPLGYSVGTALELQEAISIVRGDADRRSRFLREVVFTLGAQMLILGEVARTEAEAREKLEAVVANGKALAKMRELAAAQGGAPRVIDDPTRLEIAPVRVDVPAAGSGYIRAVATEQAGMVAASIGAGRDKASDPIDNGVGLHLLHRIGDRVEQGQPLAIMYCRDADQGRRAAERFAACYEIGPEPSEGQTLIYCLVDEHGVHGRNLLMKDVM